MLPHLVLAKRLDAVDVIGRGVATKLTSRLGLRPIAEQHTTVRSWLERFSDRSPMLLAQCTALAVAMDGTAVDVTAGAARERAALKVTSTASVSLAGNRYAVDPSLIGRRIGSTRRT